MSQACTCTVVLHVVVNQLTILKCEGSQAQIQDFAMGVHFCNNVRNEILFQYLRDKEKKKERQGLRKRRGVKIHPFHLPWIRAWVNACGTV